MYLTEKKNKENIRLRLQKISEKGKGLLAVCLLLILTGSLLVCYEKEHLQERYAGEVVRFHILANSDSKEDQALKLEVRNQVGGYLEQLLWGASSREETLERIAQHLPDIERVAAEEIVRQGYQYPVTASIEEVDFPVKTYGSYHLPAGRYTSLQMRIGEAKGANWWCVAYPNMCFMDGVYEVVEQQEKEQLYQVFSLYEYKKLIESPRKEIRFRYFK